MDTNRFYVQYKGSIRGPITLRNLQHFVKINQITPETPILVEGSTEWRRAGEIAGLFPKPQFTGQINPIHSAPPAVSPTINPVRSAPSVASPETSRKTPEKSTSPKHTTTKSFDWKKLLLQKPLVISAVLVLLCVVMGLVLVLGTSSKEEKEQTAQAPEVSEEAPENSFSEPEPAPVQPVAVPPKQNPHQKEIETFYKTGENFFSQKVYREAIYWYEKSEELPEAQYKLGICYSQGLGVSVNKEKAVKYFLKLAQENNAQAQYELGLCYLRGDGVEQNRQTALDWLRKAANQGFAQAATAVQEEEAKIAEEKRQAELARQEAERRAEEARQAAERARQEAERKAEEERLAAERRAEEERQAAERRAAEERLAAERRAREHSAGERMVKTVNGVEFAFRWCPPGTFMMGSPNNENGRRYTETQHQVTLSKGFWMLETEVTQAMWQSVMGNNPSYYRGNNLPVEQVSWNSCREFCRRLSGRIGMIISLPTEAQWEYACRAGTTGPYAGNLDAMGWHLKNAGTVSHPVGQKQPNAWGLYDMHGNVEEWCLDILGEYPSGSVTDPEGVSRGYSRIVRGGCMRSFVDACRSASRSGFTADKPSSFCAGFRPVSIE